MLLKKAEKIFQFISFSALWKRASNKPMCVCICPEFSSKIVIFAQFLSKLVLKFYKKFRVELKHYRFSLILGQFSSNHMFPLFVLLPEKKILGPNWPYISTFQTKIRNVCLLYVVYSTSAAYNSLCRGLKYLLKVGHIILDCPKVAKFSISNTVFWCRKRKHCPKWLKNPSQKWAAFVFSST